ncbi:reverse transcriptase domain, Reverse transcriptase zinc-binding domain protein [Artemisia annua]|uniref:Reverse transcriptase domain, Reverse transcriptase zinc-binding domain protein n=1 Tax=Artemisia annua TaxID=35608 RepID=A0A2U1MWZ5_ARTAN|nr:reverse transcriptase domain, Reverse transcriptase zinc-binding domain protein [Artemisia annua]
MDSQLTKTPLSGIPFNDTHSLATLNQQPSSLPCTYLGLPIGANMNKGDNWKPIIENFHKKLTSWKARNLSFGGRLTLIKSVLVCSPISCGGLRITSLHASNLAMLVKWHWRFYTKKNSLWRNLITAIHGTHKGLEQGYPSNSIRPSTRKTIFGLNKSMYDLNIDLNSVFVKKVGDDISFAFWKDLWIGEQKLETLFPRLFSLEVNKDCKVVDHCNLTNGPHTRTWQWRRPVRDDVEKEQLDGLLNILHHFNPSSSNDCREYSIDASVKIFSWRLAIDRLPTLCNLDKRDIDLDSTRCPLCDDGLESSQHIFVDCKIANSVWRWVSKW